ncbi:MAG: LPS assembly protein LptD [Candidatus Brocadiia bacterium]
MSRYRFRVGLLLALFVFPFLVGPADAVDTSDILRLESHGTVTTWEEDGVRVFVAEKGALLRQGDFRISAPRMVAWLHKERSMAQGAPAAVVGVYAEGIALPRGGLGRPVAVAEDRRVRRVGAVFMELTSTFSFAWDGPVEREPRRQPSELLIRAEELTRDLTETKFWEEVPTEPAPEGLEVVQRMLSAEQVQVFTEGDLVTFVYMGDVHGSYGDLTVRADQGVLWYDREREEFEIYAAGDVRVAPRPGAPEPEPVGPQTPTEDIIPLLRSASADELYINPGRARALAGNAELRVADPEAPEQLVYVFRGERAYLINSQTLTVRNVAVTSCNFARPHYQFFAERAQIVRDAPSTFLTAWNAQLQVGEKQTSLLWLPFIGTDLTERAYLLTDYALGSSDKFGFFVQTTWRPLDLTTKPAWVEDWFVNLDYYGSRGPAVGTELEYASPGRGYPEHEGRIRGYYVHDTGDEDDTELPVPREDRGRFHVEHRTQLNQDWRVDAEYYWLSDEGFLNEYFEEDFEQEKTPESYLLARYLRNSTYLALLYKGQVNEFLTQLEETPSATLEFLGLPYGRFVYDGTVQAGVFDQEISDLIIPAPPDPPSLARLHTDHMVSLPFSVGVLRFDPYVRALATYAEDSAFDGTDFGGSESRTGVGAGATVSSTFWRVYPAASEFFDLNRLRHILIPYAGVETLSVSGADSADFIQMDAVDIIDSGTETTVGLRQRLQTKRQTDGQWSSVNWIELDVAYVARSSDSVVQSLDEDFVRADFEWQVTDSVSLHSRDNRLGLDNLPDVVNFGALLNFRPAWSLGLDYDRIEDVSTTVTASLLCELSRRYMLLVFQQFELDSAGTGQNRNMETRVVIRRLLDQWVLDLGVHFEESNDEFALIFGFGPRGWGLYTDPRRPTP